MTERRTKDRVQKRTVTNIFDGCSPKRSLDQVRAGCSISALPAGAIPPDLLVELRRRHVHSRAELVGREQKPAFTARSRRPLSRSGPSYASAAVGVGEPKGLARGG
jgi:hypothetical protein